MYKVISDLFPFRLRDIVQNTSQVHSHKFKVSDIPIPFYEAVKRSFQYRRATLWNDVPIQAGHQATLTSLKHPWQHNCFFIFVIFVNIVYV